MTLANVSALPNQVLLGDCLEVMASLPDASVDCILTDLPYGTTRNKWDTTLPMDRLWALWKRVARPGAPVILFTQQPFTTAVMVSNPRHFRTEWIWQKPQGTGFLNARRYPLKSHENIVVFCDRLPPYNPQKGTGGTPYSARSSGDFSSNYGKFIARRSGNVDGSRFPTTVLQFHVEREPGSERGLHPTQKPLGLCKYLIRTYTQPGQRVLDCCAGSGTTLVAAIDTGRNFTGIELDPTYHAICERRIAAAELNLKQQV